MGQHSILCFCARCTGATSKKGGNRGHLNGKPKQQSRDRKSTNPHNDGLKGNRGNGGGKRR